MSIFRKSFEAKQENTQSMSSDMVAEALQKKWWVSMAFAKPAALIMQWKQEEAVAILNSPTPNADAWMKLSKEKAANDDEAPTAMAA